MNKISINANQLKVVAIIAMIIDHIGYYFWFMLTDEVYLITRIIGRIAMPIFVFLIIQGYFKTSNVKKYIGRLLKLAIITQLIISLIFVINFKLLSTYDIGVYKELNILFSFCLSLCIIYIIDKRNIISKINFTNNLFRVLILAIVISIYILLDIDYSVIVPMMAVEMYINEIINNKESKRKKCGYNILLFLIVFTNSIFQEYIGIFSILSLIFILLYNGKLGKKSIFIQKTFYYIFPIQHSILYLLAMLFYIKQ